MNNQKINQFLKEYDINDNLGFDNLKYRTGAPITSRFGLVTGYEKKEDGSYDWSTIRHHTGVDRSWGEDGSVYSPFYFNRSEFHEYGSDHIYGSLIRLFNDEYGFEMRIVHMHPKKDIDSTAYHLFLNSSSIEKNTYLGKCGTYGSASSGEHTHTEIISQSEDNEIFNSILYRKYGKPIYNNYTEHYVINLYKSKEKFKNYSNKEILDTYNSLIQKRRVVGLINDYMYQYKDWFYDMKKRTRYSSAKLFNGL